MDDALKPPNSVITLNILIMSFLFLSDLKKHKILTGIYPPVN